MDRREFLKNIGKAGVAIGAGGLLSASILKKAFGDDEAPAAGAASGPLVIRLKGTPKEMGFQYAEQAHDLIKERLRLMHDRGCKIPMDNVEMSRIFIGVTSGSVLQEISSIAAKLGEKEEDILSFSAETPGVGLRTGGCSSLILDKSVTRDGKVWMGQNVDDSSELEKFGVIIVRHPVDSPASITWTFAGSIGGIGMNANGLALLMNFVQTGQRRPPNAIFPEIVANMALRQKTFKDAVDLIAESQIMAPVTYLLANKENERLIVERTPMLFSAFTKDSPYSVYTNHFEDPKIAGDDTTDKFFPDSKPRLKRLDHLLAARANKKDIDVDYIKKVLGDTEGNPNGICRHANPPTVASLIMCPKDGIMLATKGAPDSAKYQEITLTSRG